MTINSSFLSDICEEPHTVHRTSRKCTSKNRTEHDDDKEQKITSRDGESAEEEAVGEGAKGASLLRQELLPGEATRANGSLTWASEQVTTFLSCKSSSGTPIQTHCTKHGDGDRTPPTSAPSNIEGERLVGTRCASTTGFLQHAKVSCE